jgi:TolB protein
VPFTARVEDAAGNGATVAAAWSVQGGIGTISDSGVFTASTPGSGSVNAAFGALTDSVNVTVTSNGVASLEIIAPDGVDLENIPSGGSVPFSVIARDAEGDPVSVVPTWGVQGDIGEISAQGVFTAGRAGAGQITAQANGVQDTLAVRVVPGPPAQVEILLPPGFTGNNLTIGDQIDFDARVLDAAGNVTQATVAWTVSGGIGTVNNDGLFSATKVGSGQVIASVGSLHDAVELTVATAFKGDIVCEVLGTGDLMILHPDLSDTILSSGPDTYADPCWSPDGSKIAFVSSGTTLSGICVMNADGSGKRALYSGHGLDPIWSPDGTKIAFSTGQIAGGQICLLNAATGEVLGTLVTGIFGNPRYPQWSPDGTKMAFSVEIGAGVTDGVYVIDLPTTGPAVKIYDGEVRFLRWAPNGTGVAVAEPGRIVLAPANGGAPQTLVTESQVIAGGFDWAPDGSALVYGLQKDASVQLFLARLASGVKAQLTHLPSASAMHPSWTW